MTTALFILWFLGGLLSFITLDALKDKSDSMVLIILASIIWPVAVAWTAVSLTIEHFRHKA